MGGFRVHRDAHRGVVAVFVLLESQPDRDGPFDFPGRVRILHVPDNGFHGAAEFFLQRAACQLI